MCKTARPDFDRVARVYHLAELLSLGPLLRFTRESCLDQAGNAHRALLLGDGDGRFAAALLRRYPNLRVLAVDSSRAMLHLLGRRCAFAGDRLQTRRQDVRQLGPVLLQGSFDLVVTHFFLDCLSSDDVRQLCMHLAKALPLHALWLVSDFDIPHGEPWASMGRLYIRGLYAVFRLLTGLQVRALPPMVAHLEAAGFERIYRRSRVKNLLFSEVWRLARKPEG